MTAAELIKELQVLPPDIIIVVRGYEDRYNNILSLKQIKIKQNEDSHWYDGEFDDSTDADAFDAVNLYGDNKNAID